MMCSTQLDGTEIDLQSMELAIDVLESGAIYRNLTLVAHRPVRYSGPLTPTYLYIGRNVVVVNPCFPIGGTYRITDVRFAHRLAHIEVSIALSDAI